MITLDAAGNIAFPFNTEGMYRGWIGEDGVPHVAVFAGGRLSDALHSARTGTPLATGDAR